MALQFLASVEYDCDGKFSRIIRVDVPSWMRDDESMIKALELGQVKISISDPTEWFTVPVELHDTVREHIGFGPDKTYCQVPGNIFDA